MTNSARLGAPAADKDQLAKDFATELPADLLRLSRWAEGLEPKLERAELMGILKRWSEKDAQAALSFVDGAPHVPERNAALAVPLAAICVQDPQLAIAWIRSHIVDQRGRFQVTEAIVEQMIATAPAPALVLASASDIPVSPELYGQLVGTLARTNPETALLGFDDLPSETKQAAMASMVRAWAAVEPSAAITWFRGRRERSGDVVQSIVAACLETGRFSPAQLLDQLQLSAEETSLGLFAVVGSDAPFPEQLMTKVEESDRAGLVSRMIWQRFAKEPDRLLRIIKTILPASAQRQAIEEGWLQWLDSDRKAATRWALEITDRQVGDALLRGDKLRQLQREEPQAALALLSTISDPAERGAATISLLSQWAYGRPATVADWVLHNGAEGLDDRLVDRVTSGYLERDEGAAMDWITRLPAGGARDCALGAAAEYWTRKEDAPFAGVALNAIADPAKRQAATFQTYRILCRSDVAAAEGLLEEQGIPPAIRQSWKAIVER